MEIQMVLFLSFHVSNLLDDTYTMTLSLIVAFVFALRDNSPLPYSGIWYFADVRPNTEVIAHFIQTWVPYHIFFHLMNRP